MLTVSDLHSQSAQLLNEIKPKEINFFLLKRYLVKIVFTFA